MKKRTCVGVLVGCVDCRMSLSACTRPLTRAQSLGPWPGPRSCGVSCSRSWSKVTGDLLKQLIGGFRVDSSWLLRSYVNWTNLEKYKRAYQYRCCLIDETLACLGNLWMWASRCFTKHYLTT